MELYTFVEAYLAKNDHYNSEKLIGLKETIPKVYPQLENDGLLQ